jgi:hypothetical protein
MGQTTRTGQAEASHESAGCADALPTNANTATAKNAAICHFDNMFVSFAL